MNLAISSLNNQGFSTSATPAKAHSFVLAESFDAMPDSLYDTVEAFTAPILEPEYLDFTTCLHCDDSGVIEAVNQYHQDVLAPCPHCEGGKVESCVRTEVLSTNVDSFEKLSCDNNLTAHVSSFSYQWENSVRDESSVRTQVLPPTKTQPRFNMPAIYLTIYSQMEREGKLTIWERKHRDSLLNAA